MDKNAINRVARTYQRLVEAAIKQPPMPLEPPDADIGIWTDVDEPAAEGNPSDILLLTPEESLRYDIADILEQLANCGQTNNCDELMREYIILSNLLRYIRYGHGIHGSWI
jgi:hypothetical protein